MKYAFLFIATVLVIAGCDSRDRGVVDPTMTADSGTALPDGSVMLPDASTTPDTAVPSVRDMIPPDTAAICDRVGPGFIEACDVEREYIVIPADTPRPEYSDLFPGIADPFNMNGWEWWQKWPGGFNPTYEEPEASDMGMRCSVASALRYAAIMEDPPANVRRMLADTTWEGRFFNWNDDYSHLHAEGEADGAVLWAWEWYLIKWISQTDSEGNCYLPTLSMLERAAENCLAVAAASDGVLQGCQD
jgi:hypothetical protein